MGCGPSRTAIQMSTFLVDGRRYGTRSAGSFKWSSVSATSLKGESRTSYDRVGNMLTYVDPNGHATTITYDSRGLQRSLADPDLSNCANPNACRWEFKYDLGGRLLMSQDARRQRVTLRRDELGRVYSKDYCDNGSSLSCGDNPDVQYIYDSYPNGLGRLATSRQLGELQNAVSYEYDKWGRVLRATHKVRDVTATTESRYDFLGRVLQITYPGQSLNGISEVTYGYDFGGRVKSVDVTRRDGSQTPFIVDRQYDPLGRVTSALWANGTTSAFEYYGYGVDAPRAGVGKLKRYDIFRAAICEGCSPTTLDSAVYTYFDDGNIESTAWPGRLSATVYEYDYASRLVGASTDGDLGRLLQFRYASNGTPERAWDESMPATQDTWYRYRAVGDAAAGPKAVIGTAADPESSPNYIFRYDPNGSLTQQVLLSSGATTTYTYNFDRSLIRIQAPCPNGSSNVFVTRTYYDSDQNPALASVPSTCSAKSTLKYYLGDYFQLVRTDLGTASEANEERSFIVVDGRKVGFASDSYPGELFFFHDQPNVGSITMVTDSSGAVRSRRAYGPFGDREHSEGDLQGLDTDLPEARRTGTATFAWERVHTIRSYDACLHRMRSCQTPRVPMEWIGTATRTATPFVIQTRADTFLASRRLSLSGRTMEQRERSMLLRSTRTRLQRSTKDTSTLTPQAVKVRGRHGIRLK